MEIRVVLQYFEIKGGEKIGTTQRTARMTTLSAINHSDYIPSDLRSDCF